jgi:hypothetical protein
VSAEPLATPGIEDAARLLGDYAAVEGRLFEVLGALAATEAVPEAAVLLDALSHQHAWHASLFAECRPQLPGQAETPMAPPPPAAKVLEGLAALEDSAARLAALARLVLPRLVVGYRRHLARARALSDANVKRALRLVLRDEIEAMVEAETVLESLLARPGASEVTAQAANSLEKLVAEAGPGLVGWIAEEGGSPDEA